MNVSERINIFYAYLYKGGVKLLKEKQKKMIEDLHEILVNINEKAINDEQFYEWLNENYFFEHNLEDVIIKVKEAKEKM